MKGYSIREELYNPIAHRTIACTLLLENGYEITGTYCINIEELIHEDQWKQKAYQAAYAEYKRMKNMVDRQTLFTIRPLIDRGERIEGIQTERTTV